VVTYSYIQFEYKVQSSGINGNFVVSWIVIYCWAAGKLMISIICRIHSRSLPKFNQFLSGPQNLSIPQSSQKCTSMFLSYANKQTNTETDKQRWKQNPCQNWQSDGVNQRSYSTPGLVSSLVLGWVIVCRWVNPLGLWPATQANSAFHLQWSGKWVLAKMWQCFVAGE